MRRTLLLCAASAVFGGLVSAYLVRSPEHLPQAAAQESMQQPFATPIQSPANAPGMVPITPPLVEEEYTVEERVSIGVYENVNRGVVNITTESVRSEGILFELASKGEGSGSVITPEGHILTNFHVIDGAREIRVTLFDGKTYEARLVGQDPTVDIAVVKIEAPPESLFPIPFGDSSRLRVGQRVYAIGNPFGLERTLSTGIVSSLDRTLPSRRSHRTIKQIIQIDASINPGNSGGPLLDGHSRMIGMNTAIASKTGESAGVGFAIPVSTIARVVPQLIKNGRVIRPEIGIARVYQTDKGLLIASLVPGGPAERAGLRGPRVVTQRRRQGPFSYDSQTIDRTAADLIVAVDGRPIRKADEFLSIIEAKQPGATVTVGVIRGGQETNVVVRLGAGEE